MFSSKQVFLIGDKATACGITAPTVNECVLRNADNIRNPAFVKPIQFAAVGSGHAEWVKTACGFLVVDDC